MKFLLVYLCLQTLWAALISLRCPFSCRKRENLSTIAYVDYFHSLNMMAAQIDFEMACTVFIIFLLWYCNFRDGKKIIIIQT